MCSDDFQPRLRAADLQRLAEERQARLLEEGAALHPVVNTTRKLARNFWGSAWMKQLALCEAGGMCLAPGRTLLRHGCVLDVQLAPCTLTALVSAEELYEVELHLSPMEGERLDTLAAACSGHIDSLLSLLDGKLDTAVLQQLCHPENGLLPTPQDWSMRCSCPDWAEPCPHAAAAIYAAGCLIDSEPAQLFTLRGLNPSELLKTTRIEALDSVTLSAMFGIDLDLPVRP